MAKLGVLAWLGSLVMTRIRQPVRLDWWRLYSREVGGGAERLVKKVIVPRMKHELCSLL